LFKNFIKKYVNPLSNLRPLLWGRTHWPLDRCVQLLTLELTSRPVRTTLSDPTTKKERAFAEPHSWQPFVRRSRSLSISIKTSQPLSDKWTQERDQMGIWFLLKTFFEYSFPIASTQSIDGQKPSGRALTELITTSGRGEISTSFESMKDLPSSYEGIKWTGLETRPIT
jgi:hypothetical protein